MKQFVSMIQSFAHMSGKDVKRVVDDLLSYIIGYFNAEPEPIKGWSYTKEQNAEFHKMMLEYIRLMDEQLAHAQWYDAWGNLFMSLTPGGGSKGQFFTPPDICDLMAQMNINTDVEPTKVCRAFGKRVLIGDPTAGSSRNLLATHVRFVDAKKPIPYLVAEDCDEMCCKMSAVNLMVHGCIGEVICHDTLVNPKGVTVGYLINEGLYPFKSGVPTIRIKREPQWFVSLC
ncbi:type I restriction enzyme M protein [Xylanibacter ruminicola]|uniref:Type I restriction enzyme M protein n=1 Tax=Xylanibacter ruminicola TaxID=839 RepID=A0A1M7D0B8_XYLRU|nr:N-6 DNA methylase [Xylanibacter ruminicola]SHL72619.1 type I restriction enzyme M protein [Xylanibacter ruminicola]